MNVSAALKLGDLQKATVLAGVNGINREIKAAEVMEVPDISGWLTEGIVIISTFYSIKDSPQSQIEMFKTLINVNGAALIIKLGRYVNDLPKEMYDLANKHNMPIISIPVEVSFVNVLTALFEKIYEEKKAYRQEQLQLMNQLINTEVKSLQDFVIELSSITGDNVYFESGDNRLLVYAKKERDKKRRIFSFLSKPEELTSPQIDYTEDCVFEEDRLVIPIDESGECVGYLHVLLIKSKSLLNVLQNCSASIKEQTKLLLLKERYEIEKRYLQDNKFIHYLLEEKEQISPSYIKKYISLEENHLYGLFAFDFSFMNETLLSIQEKDLVTNYFLFKKIYEIVDRALPNTYLFNEGHFFGGLYICKNQQSRPALIEKLQHIVKQFDKEFNSNIYCGVSLAHESFHDLYKALDEVKVSIQTRNDMNLNDKIIVYESMGVNKILLKLKNDRDVLHFIEAMLETIKFDDKENGELIRTLEVFLQENGNHSKTSEKLYIHRRTLKYRLTKIESTLNINLDDSETRFLLFLLLKMRKIHENSRN
ncbi:hypothetical protein J2S74_000169 [Evansella vedderi]|uniref:PucR family transcriptional regulator n=1 Tax=Evansella vedderi TaxID=38282 RepID=A0ABT9ZNJ2_9BACI|nr:PucR family transcriptional regulator [Evansella vedderi]MDQ0252797.1 hypothetical protein [Evansella vedderi]